MNRILTSRIVAIAATAGLTMGALIGVAGSASAATSGGTTVTFQITAGPLAITVPASTVALATGTVNTGASSASGQLGSVTVNDTRGLLVNSWTATITTTTFTTGAGATSQTVATSAIAYTSGAATSTSGLGSFVPTLTATTIGSTVTGASWSGLAGNDSATWNPTITFTLLSSQVAGLYSGTITHSVA
jgi:hypothetical protein